MDRSEVNHDETPTTHTLEALRRELRTIKRWIAALEAGGDIHRRCGKDGG
jgi:hypothetical protein